MDILYNTPLYVRLSLAPPGRCTPKAHVTLCSKEQDIQDIFYNIVLNQQFLKDKFIIF